MFKSIFILLITLVFIVSCNNNPENSNSKDRTISTEQVNQRDITPEYEDGDLKPITIERNINEDRANAKSTITDFLNKEPKKWEFLTLNYYIVDYIADGKGAPKDLLDIGEWYKFNQDFTYSHGFFDKIEDQGIYSYDIENSKLTILPNENKKYQSEWRVLHSGDVIVLIGTAKFGNNPYQKHMQNIEKQPEISK